MVVPLSRAPAEETRAETPAEVHDGITLPEVFDLLKQRSPTFKAVESEIDVAKSQVRAARVLPNPIIQLSILYLNVGFNQNGVATYYANATLPVLIAGQRRMRVKTANVGVRSAEASVRANYADLAHEARELFVELQANQEKVKVLDSALADLAKLTEMITTRSVSGYETKYDIVRMNVELSVWEARRAEEEAEVQDTAGQLGVLLGLPRWYPEAQGPFAQLGIKGDADRIWPELERSQPGIVAAQREESFAVQNIDLTRRERWPVPSVTVGTVAIQNYYSISTSVGLTVPVPVFDWGQGMMAQANARSQRARLQKEAVVASARAELDRAIRLLEHRRSTLRTFEERVLGQLPTLQQMSEDSFRDGQVELIDLLDATRSRFEVKLTHIDMLEGAIQAEVDMLAVTGRIEDMTPR